MTPPCCRAKLCNQGQICPQGKIGDTWWHWVGNDQQCHSIPLNAQDSPKDYLAPNVMVSKMRNFAAQKNQDPCYIRGKGPELKWGLLCLQKQRIERNQVTEGNQTSLLIFQSRASSGILYSRQGKSSLNPMKHISSSVSSSGM